MNSIFGRVHPNINQARGRLWCHKYVKTAEREESPTVLQGVIRRYGNQLNEAQVVDLVYMCVPPFQLVLHTVSVFKWKNILPFDSGCDPFDRSRIRQRGAIDIHRPFRNRRRAVRQSMAISSRGGAGRSPGYAPDLDNASLL